MPGFIKKLYGEFAASGFETEVSKFTQQPTLSVKDCPQSISWRVTTPRAF